MMSSMASISSSSSATVRVEKATSEFLMGPDWTMNIDICDTINTNQMLAKDVVKAVKKRLQHKNPKVQLLSLTLLETMVKNCGDYVHFQIAERSILQDMVKIVKKRTDMHVRDKVLTLIGSWHEAFGGSQGRYPQYYMAYEDLRRSGVEFPRVSPDAVPIFTPPVTHPLSRPPQPGYGMPSSSSTRLDEVMAAEENFSLSSLNSMRDIMDLLTDMLQAVDPSDRKAVKDEVIVDLVGQCQVNQRKLVDMLASTGDEELLFQGLELNDRLQSVLAKHDAIASGSPLPSQLTDSTPEASEKHNTSPKPVAEVSNANPPPAQIVPVQKAEIDEEEEEEDDFAQLARRHTKPHMNASQNTTNMALKESSSTGSIMSNALVPITPPAPVETKDQDIIDLLSLTLSTATLTEQQQTSETPMSHMHSQTQGQIPPASQEATFSAEPYHTNHGLAFNNYVAPWAQPQQQPQPLQTQYSQYTAYPPPPWAATPGYLSTPNHMLRPPQTYSMPGPTSSMYRPLQHESINNGQAQVYSGSTSVGQGQVYPGSTNVGQGQGQGQVYPGSTNVGQGQGQKPFIPSYRLFEDLNVLGNSNTDERYKGKSSSSSLSGSSSNQSMVGGRK